jgi:hypothetical protein
MRFRRLGEQQSARDTTVSETESDERAIRKNAPFGLDVVPLVSATKSTAVKSLLLTTEEGEREENAQLIANVAFSSLCIVNPAHPRPPDAASALSPSFRSCS